MNQSLVRSSRTKLVSLAKSKIPLLGYDCHTAGTSLSVDSYLDRFKFPVKILQCLLWHSNKFMLFL